MKDITDKEFELLRAYIKKNSGINLNDDKRSLIYSRLRTTLIEKGFDDFTEYYQFLINDKTGNALQVFLNKITTNHTYFMRETDHFDYLNNIVLPYIDQTYSKQKDLRLWCAASSSGEEPYTLAMIINDYFHNKPGWDIQILATDISINALTKAQRGVYTAESVKTLSPEWQKKYFIKKTENEMEVHESLKKNVIFRKFNLMDEHLPFKKKFQVIFCRNVMIYFDAETRNNLVKRMYDATEPGGYLFVGHSETLNVTDASSGIKYNYQKPAIYKK